MVPEKYSRPPQAPPTFVATAESILEESYRVCADTQVALDKLVAAISLEDATFESAIREAAAGAEEKWSHFLIDCRARDDVFRLVDAVFRKNEDLDPESCKLLAEERRNFVRDGLALSSQGDKNRLKEIKKCLSTIGIEFVRNLDEEEAVVWFTLDELAGVPEDALSELSKSTGELEGKLKVTSTQTDVSLVMRLALSPETRREIYTRRISLGEKNIGLFAEAIHLRYEAARILGYANHAAFRLETEMAKTPEAVMTFLENIRDRALARRSKDIDELLAIKQADLSSRKLPVETELYMWDVHYYTRLLEKKHYSVDQCKIAEYFPSQQTVASMLKLFGDLFGFVFVELGDDGDRARLSPTGKGSDLTWHEDVIMHSIWDADDEGGAFAGYLYLDLHPRPGKYGGAQCHAVQLGFTRLDGSRHCPSTALLANFTKPTRDKPSLLGHSEVWMLFHELGHGIHDLAGRTRYSCFSGASTVGDFNEAPSQMLENWCWVPSGLRLLSSHYKTGEPLPDSMIEALVRTRHHLPSMGLLVQLRMCLFDMAVHSRCGDGGEADIGKIYAQYVDLPGTRGPEDKHGYAAFRHLLQGYDAGCYSYLWSKVMAMDMFDTAFKEDPLSGEQGRRYRHMIIGKGGSQDEKAILTQFLGRESRPDAFLENLGL